MFKDMEKNKYWGGGRGVRNRIFGGYIEVELGGFSFLRKRVA